MAFMEEFEHLKIQLEDIKSATDDFDDNNVIGSGGFGNVYKGAISDSNVAIKRLDSRHGQGNAEFWREIMMLSRYTHENVVSLVGFCDEGGEKILVYDHASRGSLDRHLSSTDLTWTQRVKICLDVARGLSYLHDDKGTQQRVLHRDIKSSNILLYENWNAKISDLGLSKIGPANQKYTVVISNVVGTLGYLDPLYMKMGILTKESDVYSFGVVLFEVLCGRLCFQNSDDRFQILVRTWKESYKHNNLDGIIFQDMKQQMDPASLETFSNIAYQCLQKSYEQRPTMSHVVEKLEFALELQEIFEEQKKIKDYENMIKTAITPVIHTSQVELNMLFSDGVLFSEGKTGQWFSIDKNGARCEMISAAECLIPSVNQFENIQYKCVPKENARFVMNDYQALDGKFKIRVKPQFLIPKVTYTVNLVFQCLKALKEQKYGSPKYELDVALGKLKYVTLKYTSEGETQDWISYLADRRDDGWLTVELYEFTSDSRNIELEIFVEPTYYYPSFPIVVEGIEFRHVDRVGNEVLEEKKEDMQLKSYSDTDIYWEQKLPYDYDEIIKWSKDRLQWTTKKELYTILCKGFLINNDKKWFSLAKNGKKCYMLPSSSVLRNVEGIYYSLPKSRFFLHNVICRFEEVACNKNLRRFSIVCEIKSDILSPQTTYVAYIVYNFPINHSGYKAPVMLKEKDFHLSDNETFDFQSIYLVSPQTPVLRLKSDQNTPKPINRPKRKGIPQLRNDGWMEVQVWEFQTATTIEIIPMRVDLITCYHGTIAEIIVQGIEFRPE